MRTIFRSSLSKTTLKRACQLLCQRKGSTHSIPFEHKKDSQKNDNITYQELFMFVICSLIDFQNLCKICFPGYLEREFLQDQFLSHQQPVQYGGGCAKITQTPDFKRNHLLFTPNRRRIMKTIPQEEKRDLINLLRVNLASKI